MSGAIPAWKRYWMPWTALALVLGGIWLIILRQLHPGGNAVSSMERLPLLLIAAVFAGLAAVRGRGRERTAWTCMTLAITAILAGELAWAARFISGGTNPAFGLSDVFYLSYFPLITAGILMLPKRITGRTDALRFLLDAGIVVVGGGMMVWLFAVQPALAKHGDAVAGYVHQVFDWTAFRFVPGVADHRLVFSFNIDQVNKLI